ncbi:MAG: PEP-CTERM sorting domain-containing protein [Planctomycetes bacterium]|nr:PEP-CTERM sorting domain-containing protein [Planctomycetota bacterium]
MLALASVVLLGLSPPSASADITYTITDNGSSGFTITGTGSSGTDDDDFRVNIVNNSSRIIQQLQLTSGFKLFNLDGDGPPEGGGFGPGGYNNEFNTFTINSDTNGFVNFTNPNSFGIPGLAPGASDFFALENDNGPGGDPVDIAASQINVAVTRSEATPEPASFVLFGLVGLVGAGYARYGRWSSRQ